MSSGLSLENYFFGPLDKRYCLLFYVFGVIMFFVFIVGLLGFLYNLFKGKKMSTSELFFMAYSLLASFLGYLTYRLLHTMCVSSAIAEKA